MIDLAVEKLNNIFFINFAQFLVRSTIPVSDEERVFMDVRKNGATHNELHRFILELSALAALSEAYLVCCFAQLSLRPMVRLKTRWPGVES